MIGWVMSPQARPLRRGWTTGACATAAAKAAYAALLTGEFPDPVEIALPRGERPSFALATVRAAAAGSGVVFRAGEGIGTVTRPGLPIPPGEPAINPVPRKMMRDV